MKRTTNILFSVILLVLTLLGTSGVSVERCSCTGHISLTIPINNECCPDDSGCMEVKSMQLSDYMPTSAGNIEMPVQPLLFNVFPTFIPTATVANAQWQLESHCAQAPPEALAHTVAVLRV